MPLFMFVAGYVLTREDGIIRNVCHKMRRLLIPFCAWGAIVCFAMQRSPVDLILYPTNGLWFLWTLAFDIGVVALLVRNSRESVGYALLKILIAGLMVLAMIKQVKLFSIHQISYYLWFVLGGYACRLKGRDWLARTWLVSFVLWIILALFWVKKGAVELLCGIQLKGFWADGFRFVTAWVGVGGLFGAFQKFGNLRMLSTTPVVMLGQMTLGIYAVHEMIHIYFSSFKKCDPLLLFFALMVISIASVLIMKRVKVLSLLFLGENVDGRATMKEARCQKG